MDWIQIIIKSLLGGCAAIGFGVLFNVPPRLLISIFILGMVGILLKISLSEMGLNIILSSFVGASTIGVISIQTSHTKHAPPLVFSIPAVIPMIPGIFTYRAMLGMIKLTGEVGPQYNQILAESINNGLKAAFILMTLAVGVGLPNFIPKKTNKGNKNE
jgi:uncharacterized membrane protein YjjB (DUF3815 family)